MPEQSRGARPIKDVLGDALEELLERESRLEQFERELVSVRKAIKVLKRASGDAASPGATAGRGDVKRAVLELLERSISPLSMQAVAEGIGRKPAGWITMQLQRMVAAGELVKTGEGYEAAGP